MSGTGLDHRLVRDYLRELEAATSGLPAAQARELREQITAHLDEALGPGAGEQEIEAALTRLGSPADIAAEAGTVSPAPPAAALTDARHRGRLKRVRARTWILAGLAVLLAVAALRFMDIYTSAGPLEFNYGADWWYHQDVRHEHIAQAGNTIQNTTVIRSGQRQGYVVSIYNPTNLTQTILADGSGPTIGWNNPGGTNEQIAVSRSGQDIGNGFWGGGVNTSFTLPVSIPPHQARLVRVLWTSKVCLGKGESGGIDKLYVRVRVGWFTRTEIIPQQDWALLGPSQGGCTSPPLLPIPGTTSFPG